jgi:hypothetical protein
MVTTRLWVTGKEWERRPPNLDDVGAIRADLAAAGATLWVIDPLVAFLAPGTNTYHDLQIRQALAPIADLAAETGIAVVAARHLRKGASGNPFYAGGGA